MTYRIFDYLFASYRGMVMKTGVLAFASSAALVFAPLAAAQSAEFSLPRRVGGKPDFQGVWTNASLTGESEMLNAFTVEDPALETQAWKGEAAFRKDGERMYEYPCHDGNYALSGILAGACKQEREAAAAGQSGKGVR